MRIDFFVIPQHNDPQAMGGIMPNFRAESRRAAPDQTYIWSQKPSVPITQIRIERGRIIRRKHPLHRLLFEQLPAEQRLAPSVQIANGLKKLSRRIDIA